MERFYHPIPLLDRPTVFILLISVDTKFHGIEGTVFRKDFLTRGVTKELL